MVLTPLHLDVSAVFSSEMDAGMLFVTVDTLPPDLILRRLGPSILGKSIFPFGAIIAMLGDNGYTVKIALNFFCECDQSLDILERQKLLVLVQVDTTDERRFEIRDLERAFPCRATCTWYW